MQTLTPKYRVVPKNDRMATDAAVPSPKSRVPGRSARPGARDPGPGTGSPNRDGSRRLGPRPIKGAVVGILKGFDKTSRPLVEFDESDGAVAARTTVALDRSQTGQEVVLILERGNPRKPIVIGTLRPPLEQDVVLRCGKASVTLTRAGKVLIRGAYVLSRSSGVNRIQGGSVQIN